MQAVGLALDGSEAGLSAPSRCSTRHPSTPLRGLLLNGLGVVLWVRGELDEANVLAHRSEARGSETGDATTRLCACLVHGIVEHVHGGHEPRATGSRRPSRRPKASTRPRRRPSSPPTRPLSPSACSRSSWCTSASWSRRARVREAHARARALRAPGPQAAALWFDTLVEVRMGNAEQVADLLRTSWR